MAVTRATLQNLEFEIMTLGNLLAAMRMTTWAVIEGVKNDEKNPDLVEAHDGISGLNDASKAKLARILAAHDAAWAECVEA